MIKKVDKRYRKWISEQPCANCEADNKDYTAAHHCRILGNGGMGMKPPDSDLIPLCYSCHNTMHKWGVISFWEKGSKPKTKIYVQKLCNNYIRRYENEKSNT